MKHFHSIESLHDFEIHELLDRTARYYHGFKKENCTVPVLSGIGMSAFFEPSTRTLLSFQMAAKKLGLDMISLPEASSVSKGETLQDTILNMDAMGPDFIVIRDTDSHTVEKLIGKTNASLINAGSGTLHHPSQALLDAATMGRYFGERSGYRRLRGLKVAICGDVLHSRVASSNIQLLPRLGVELRLVGPAELLPETTLPTFTNFREGIAGADVIMMLRMQTERHNGSEFSIADYRLDRAAYKQAVDDHPVRKPLVMHPGPMNRGIEISDGVANSSPAILQQVTMGVAARMAILATLLV